MQPERDGVEPHAPGQAHRVYKRFIEDIVGEGGGLDALLHPPFGLADGALAPVRARTPGLVAAVLAEPVDQLITDRLKAGPEICGSTLPPAPVSVEDATGERVCAARGALLLDLLE